MDPKTRQVEMEIMLQEIFEEGRAEGDPIKMDAAIERAERWGYERLAGYFCELYPLDFSGASDSLVGANER
jgi:hypothetical protein